MLLRYLIEKKIHIKSKWILWNSLRRFFSSNEKFCMKYLSIFRIIYWHEILTIYGWFAFNWIRWKTWCCQITLRIGDPKFNYIFDHWSAVSSLQSYNIELDVSSSSVVVKRNLSINLKFVVSEKYDMKIALGYFAAKHVCGRMHLVCIMQSFIHKSHQVWWVHSYILWPHGTYSKTYTKVGGRRRKKKT